MINVLSTFDGMSCGRIALERAGIKVNKYFASEIDKHAIKVAMENYPETIQLGDVTKVKASDLPVIDLLIGGSPCQGFSFAGKQLNFNDPRSALFFEFVRLLEELRHINPKLKFFLENVKMAKEHEAVITKMLGVQPLEINSALVSAQNRQRLYWTNIGMQPAGLFGDMESIIPQPKDKGIYLKDILEKEVDDKYYISEKALARIMRGKYSHPKFNPEKTGTLNTKNNSGQLSVDSGTTLIIDVEGYPKRNQNKASCFTAGAHSGGNHSDMDLIVTHSPQPRNGKEQGGKGHLQKTDGKSYAVDTGNGQAVEVIGARITGRNPDNPKSRKSGEHTEQMLETRFDNKQGCLTSVHKDTMVVKNRVIQINDLKESGGKQPYQQNCIYATEGKMPALMAEARGLLNTQRIRRLTPTECERLQTVPDGYTAHVSDSQRYKMCGNGWTVDVIVHIFQYLK